MDVFCINRGTLLDSPSVATLENPAAHSVHCLVDVGACYQSGFEILTAPPAGSSTHTRFARLDAAANAAVITLARSTGACSTCAGGYGSGGLRQGFQATVVGVLDTSTSPPTFNTGSGGVYPASMACSDIDLSAGQGAGQAAAPPPPSAPPPLSYLKSEIAGYDWMYSPPGAIDGYTVHWSVSSSSNQQSGERRRELVESAETLSMLVTMKRRRGWIGIAFSPTGNMVGSDAVIGWVDGTAGTASVELYALEGQSEGAIRLLPGALNGTNITSESVDGEDMYTMAFTRPLCVEDQLAQRCVLADAQTTMLWAAGDQPMLIYHSAGRGRFPLALSGNSDGSTLAIPSKAYKRLAHALCMMMGWGVFLPSGVGVAVGLKDVFGPRWLYIHIALQVVGLATAIAGFVIAVVNFHAPTHSSHGTLGLVVMILGGLQPINGLLRPHKPAANEKKSTARFAWEVLHKGSGWIALCLAVPTMALGVNLLRDLTGEYFPEAGTAMTFVYASVTTAVFLLVLRGRIRRPSPSGSPKAKQCSPKIGTSAEPPHGSFGGRTRDTSNAVIGKAAPPSMPPSPPASAQASVTGDLAVVDLSDGDVEGGRAVPMYTNDI